MGCDQLIVLEQPTDGEADVFMRIFNPDGGEAGACGNATRCVASVVMDERKTDQVTVQTISGLLESQKTGVGNNGLPVISVDMGLARLDWREIPVREACDTNHMPVGLGPLQDPVGTNMGNPHATFFVDDLAAIPIAELGPKLEHDRFFPERANIGVAQLAGRGQVAAACLGARRRSHARLRLGRLRGRRRRQPPRPGRSQGRDRRRRRHAHHGMAARRSCAHDRRHRGRVQGRARPVVAGMSEEKTSWLSRLRSGLSKSTKRVTESITSLFTKKKLDQETLNDLEDALIQADLGVGVAARLVEKLGKERFGKEVTDEEVRAAFADDIAEILQPVAMPLVARCGAQAARRAGGRRQRQRQDHDHRQAGEPSTSARAARSCWRQATPSAPPPSSSSRSGANAPACR